MLLCDLTSISRLSGHAELLTAPLVLHTIIAPLFILFPPPVGHLLVFQKFSSRLSEASGHAQGVVITPPPGSGPSHTLAPRISILYQNPCQNVLIAFTYLVPLQHQVDKVQVQIH